MITGTNVAVVLIMLVGTIGIIFPVLPGLVVVWAATVLWALEQQTPAAWVVVGVTTVLYGAGLVLKLLVPGRRLRAAGVDLKVIALAVGVAVVGLFVIPVLGAPIGFVGAIYLIEQLRHRNHSQAWAATRQALRAVMVSMGFELLAALAIIMAWAVGVWVLRP